MFAFIMTMFLQQRAVCDQTLQLRSLRAVHIVALGRLMFLYPSPFHYSCNCCIEQLYVQLKHQPECCTRMVRAVCTGSTHVELQP